MELEGGNEVYLEIGNYYQSIYHYQLFGRTGRYKTKEAASYTRYFN